MKIINFILIVSGFFLWNTGFLLMNPPQTMGQGMGMMRRGSMKTMMKQMMPDQLPPGIAPEKLPEPDSSGAKLLQNYCAQCHDLPSPLMHSAQEWPEVFQRMLMRMQMMSGGMMMGSMMGIKTPTSQEETTLLAYLNRHSLHAADQQTLSGLNSQSGMLFQQTCSQCHALPDPKQHTPQEWPDVVSRMKQNMQLMKLPLIQPKEEALIVQFLQHAASQ